MFRIISPCLCATVFAAWACTKEAPRPLAARAAVATARCSEELETPVSLIGVDPRIRRDIVLSAGQGLVAVRYEGKGCERSLEVVRECHHPARYARDPDFEVASRVMKNLRELRQGLSLASEALKRYLEPPGGVRADVVSVERLTAPHRLVLRRNILRGDRCDVATHVVREINIGGFSLTTGPVPRLEKAKSQFANPPSATGPIQEVGRVGDSAACLKSRDTKVVIEGCDASVAVDLLPVVDAKKVDEVVTVSGGRAGDTYVEPFFMDRTEVTVADYEDCVSDKQCEPAGRGRLCTSGVPGREKHPVNCVTYAQAEKYCAFAKKRLPTEAEWAVAAGEGAEHKFVWGDDWPPPDGAVNLADETTAQVRPHWTHVDGYTDGFATTAPVGVLRASQSKFRVADVAGNVQEWVDGKGPHGARVVRGASFGHGRPDQFEVSRRTFYMPTHRSAHVGFRCARTPGKED